MKDSNKRLFKICGLSLIAIAIGFTYYFFYRNGIFSIPCIFNKITGLYCPGCGTTKMCAYILELDFTNAVKSNPVVFSFLPFGIIMFFRNAYDYVKYGKTRLSKIESYIINFYVFIFIVFGIMRNIL